MSRQNTSRDYHWPSSRPRLGPMSWVLIVFLCLVTCAAFAQFVILPISKQYAAEEATATLSRLVHDGKIVVEVRPARPQPLTDAQIRRNHDAFVSDMRAIAGDPTLFTEENDR